MNFCDFCSCKSCREGWEVPDITHAPTFDGRWICEVCFSYDVCTSGPDRADHPCEDDECEHRPTLNGPWRRKGVE